MPTNEALSGAPSLSAAGWTRVQRGWADQLSVPIEALTSSGTHFFIRETATAVVVLQLTDSCVVVGPPPAIERLQDLDTSTLLDVTAVTARLQHAKPRLIGTASLSFRDERPERRVAVATEPADRGMVEKLQKSLSADEWDESGLSAMPRRWAALTSGGRPAAVAGFERWGADIAQLGVAADPTQRGRGYAAAVTATAISSALSDGLVAQWRCRIGNAASERLATQLGFARLGRQTAIGVG
jgi:RimJ/RimL family protein N-acetyltransferase